MNSITIDRKALTKEFLGPIGKFNQTGQCVIDVVGNKLFAFAKGDSNHNILFASHELKHVSGAVDSIHMKDVNRFANALGFSTADEMTLVKADNCITYTGQDVKFRCPLLATAVADTIRPSLKREKIEGFIYDFYAQIPSAVLSNALKGSTFAVDAEKIYISLDPTTGIAFSLEDPSKPGSNAITFFTGIQPISGTLPAAFAFGREMISNISKIDQTVHMFLNTKLGIAIFSVQTPTTTLKYIVSSFK